MIEIGKQIITPKGPMIIAELNTYQNEQGFTCGSVWAVDKTGTEHEISVDDILDIN